MGWAREENRYGDDRVHDACGLIGMMDTSGTLHSGDSIAAGLAAMDERGNGLGSGYAAYGIYPEFSEHYVFHVMCRDDDSRQDLDKYIKRHFAVVHDEPIPHQTTRGILDPPVLWRYFVIPLSGHVLGRSEEDYVVHHVMTIQGTMEGSFVMSSGKNMGIFKGVGFPEPIAEFYRIDDYSAYLWTAHNRFPTNTPGWWGGAHPFGLLDTSVVHNGEISSYGTNRRYVEMHGYRCDMRTDTEVFAYAADLLMRRHGLSLEMTASVFASPLWEELAQMPDARQRIFRALRQTYGPLLMNGPFTIILARSGEMMGLADRVRLRPLVAASKGDCLYVSSELSAIHVVENQPEAIWIPEGGEPVVGRLGQTPAPPATVTRSTSGERVYA